MPAANEQTPETIAFIDWGGFQLAMLGDQVYQRVSAATTDQRSVSRIETYFSTEAENWPLIGMLWGSMIRACPTGQGPTPAETTKWNEIAQATNMPIEFTPDGYLNPKQEE